MSVIPGTRLDYFLVVLAALDIFILMFGSSYIGYLPKYVNIFILFYDYFVITLWALDTFSSLRKSNDRIEYLKTHWYEFAGLIPLGPMRIFLLLRVVKLAILYYKFGRSRQNISELQNKEYSFRFRDVFIDAIADIVFLQSLRRVEEVMLRLDYNKLATDVLTRHEEQLRIAIKENIEKNSIIGDISKIPLLGPVSKGLGNSVSDAVIDLMQQKVLGEIFQEITATILSDMHSSLRELDLGRITNTDDNSDESSEFSKESLETEKQNDDIR